MGIPGSNILNMALTVIASQTINYFKATDRIQNDIGQDVTVYAPGVLIRGSFQPVPRRLYEVYGLDLQKDYWTFYTSNNLIDIQRNVSADQIVFKSQKYQCLSANDWFSIDGWLGMLCVLITNPPLYHPPSTFGFSDNTGSNGNENFEHGNFVGTT